MAVEVSNPWWLLVLPIVAVLLVATRLPWWRAANRVGGRALRQEGRRLAVRLGWILLLLLALSGVVLSRPLERQAVIFVLDASASTAAVRDEAEAAVRDAISGLRHDDVAGVVAVASGAGVEESPTARPLFSRIGAALSDAATDLATGLRLAGALIPEGYSGRIVLVSDGRQTRGDAVATARELSAGGKAVDVLPLGAEAGSDLRVESLEIPETAHRGEVSTLSARLYSDGSAGATLRVYQDGRLILERREELRGGRQEVVLPIPVGDPGMHRYRVDVAPDDLAVDATAANNSLGAVQRVIGPPRVLVVAPTPAASGMLVGALRATGVEVDQAVPSAVPSDLGGWARYDSVVLADVPAESLPPGAMELLESYVRDLGRGLAMAGGPDSFGPGGYADTPVERALPVYMDLRGRGRQPRVALALVVDKSGSMAGTKVEMAKEAAVRSLRLLRPEDRALVLAFDSVPQWVAPLTPLSGLQELERAVGSIYAGGGTEVYPAVAAAFGALRDVEADVKHIILLTDGRSGSGGDYLALLEQMREDRVTLSTVGVGDDADAALLEAMARAGRGRYHFTRDASSIPQLFTQETIMATRTVLVDGRFYPAASSSGPLLRGLGSVPPLDGYVATTPKERGEVVLVSPEGDPILAAWQYGLGRAVAWTPDLGGRWAGPWAGSQAGGTLWGNVISWLLPPLGEGELTVRVEPEGETAFSVVAENRSGWEEVRPTRASLLGPDGRRQEVDLSPAGPGSYRGRVELSGSGAYVVKVAQPLDGDSELRGEAGWVAPYPAEFRATGVDRAFLSRVAAAGGGRVLEDPAESVAATHRPAIARWEAGPLLLALAALLWPLEIASRRLAIPSVRPGALLARVPGGRSPRGGRRGGPAGSGGAAEEPEAAATARRLLERKRAFREGQSPPGGS